MLKINNITDSINPESSQQLRHINLDLTLSLERLQNCLHNSPVDIKRELGAELIDELLLQIYGIKEF